MSERETLLQDAPRSNPMTRTTYHPFPALVCDGIETHYSPMPSVSAERASGPVKCAECGAAMSVVDIITVRPNVDWADVNYYGRTRRYFGV